MFHSQGAEAFYNYRRDEIRNQNGQNR